MRAIAHFAGLAKSAVGHSPRLRVFFGDYSILDGTGARDYIYVTDLTEARLKTLQWMEPSGVRLCGRANKA